MVRGDMDEEEARRIRLADLILRLRRAGIMEQRVLAAMEAVPRDLFVPPEGRRDAYAERALPIDCGQTISALDLNPRDRVLEIGTGSGYQCAVLAKLCRRVYTIDRFRTLVAAAESRFKTLRLGNITTMVGDGTKGWPEAAPFDKIIVTAATDALPEALFEQVVVGGIIVAPLGPQDGVQKLKRLVRTQEGFTASDLADVRFVPLIPGTAARL
jgi:protein-L-isoaspartate(D-aspartate) O-methyltransferase